MKALRIDERGEFILEILKGIRKKKGITIKYVAPYIFEENRLVE